MSETALGVRDARGDWRPPYVIEKPIFLNWPPRPGAIAKWFLGWPGYFWPWNVFFFLFPLVSWFYSITSTSSATTAAATGC